MKNNSLNTNKIKLINQNKVFSYIYNKKNVNKVMICDELNMCLSTVNQNLKILESLDLIKKDGFFESTGGRKSDLIKINETFRYSIGIALLKKSTQIVITDLYCNIISKEIFNTPFNNSDSYYKELSHNLDSFIKSSKIDSSLILGVSIATQGIVIKNVVSYGVIMDNSMMTLESFSKYIKYNIHLEHDSKCAANLALWNTEIENGYVFLLNNNLGSAVIINSYIQPGYSGTIEHLNIGNNTMCYCGKKGCLETVCSINALETKSGLSIGLFFSKLRDGNDKCISIWEEFLSTLSLVINNLRLIVDGDIILSGKMSSYLNEDDILFIKNTIQKLRPFDNYNNILISDTGEYTQAIGASLYYIKKFIKSMK